jgi:hypothetical protein
VLDVVTVTGADDTVHPDDLLAISKQYPFVEFGILLGRIPSCPRFPSGMWRDRLCYLVEENRSLHLSAHLCGRLVDSFLDGCVCFDEHYGRHQVNTHGEPHSFDVSSVRANVRLVNSFGSQVIFQYDGVNTNAMLACLGRHPADGYDHLSVATLHDLSHGEGRLPAEWRRPIPGVYTGYAGGLSPENVAEQIEEILRVTGEQPFWIDAETHLRSDDGKRFDLDKVVRFLEASRPHVAAVRQR